MTYDREYTSTEFEPEVVTYPTLFGLTLTPKVNGILLAILGFGGALYLGSQFTLPAWQSYQEHKANVETKEAVLQQQAEISEQLNEIISSINQTKAVNADVKTLFSNQRTLDTLLLDLNQLIVRTQAQLVTFTPDYAASGPVTDGFLGPELNGKLKRQVTLVAFEGDFDQTLAIMRTMERLQTFLVVKDFSAEIPASNTTNSSDQPSQSQKQDQIRSTFKLHAYVPLSSDEAAAAKTAPAPPTNLDQSGTQPEQ